jgi:hypothetical protein
MSHVFLSYSRRNSEAAFRLYDHLQSMGVPVWIDQRSIRPGASYAEEIFLAINGASAVVLLLTTASNESKEIHREIQLAANGNVPVISFRLEPVTYQPALGYFLAALQWIDATGNEDRALSTLLDQLRRLLPAGGATHLVPATSVEPDPPAPATPAQAEASISVQQRIATAILAKYPDGKIKKIDQDHYLDIYLPSVCSRPVDHLVFKTTRGQIRVFFYCRSGKLVEHMLQTASHAERWHWGLMLIGNPFFTDPDEAVRRAVDLVDDIARAGSEAPKESRP